VNGKTTQIDVSALLGGTYLVRAVAGSTVLSFKINKV
jgi:hypothetical protein